MSEAIEFSLYKGKVKGKFYPDSHRYYVNGKSKTGVTTYIGIVDKSRALIIWATELYRDFLLSINGEVTPEHIFQGCSLHEERKQEAAAIGDEVHGWIEQYVLGNTPTMPETREAQIGVTAFLEWVDAHHVEFISSERVVYSKKHDYIGKLDIEARVNDQLCLVDIKTSNGIYNTYNLQTAAYVRADEEESGKKYHGRWIIRVAKETEAEYLERMAKKNANRQRKGQAPIDVQPYQVFEAKFLEENEDIPGRNMDRDFNAFLAAKDLYEWNKATDTFRKAA
ncbi:hypothetical protein JJE66_33705 [Bradyrhizobium diazoefficiens]|uniref:hypothetical protein n=1 Tax=Bradyrhizobium diazoefficiens TaxID=1355477 RepID=UPI0019094D14|nr:hypothetical protein [Bradyrhizobium diazoefficiens]MBK3666164.1 hypothetical protein [Bradyrhizobium diazoefficiens]